MASDTNVFSTPDLVNNPLGTPFDEPASADSITTSGQGFTLFALAKGILLELATIRTILEDRS